MTSTQGRVGVAISTTGDEHRFDLLRRCVVGWHVNLPCEASLFVTVDGDDAAVARVALAVKEWTGGVYQVGHNLNTVGTPLVIPRDGRLGVAVNKNTGLELLMNVGVEHLFLSDDDAWPINPFAADCHTNGYEPHSMVNWGGHRLKQDVWDWPRGAVLYARRDVVLRVGGMVEAFGPGGHEHVEWSRRIHQHGLTPALYPSPLVYSDQGGLGARQFWHAEDMPRPGERRANLVSRRRGLTSVRRQPGDWAHIEKILAEMDGKTDFVPYAANENGRASATLYENT